jgi:hypothetical protein
LGGSGVRGFEGIEQSRLVRGIMLGIIPAIMVLVAVRQLYLQKTEDLSVWKGGGMGMFASADSLMTRFAKVYLLLPDGERQPLLRFTPQQELLLQNGLWFPTESNFRLLADSIKATTWWASTDRVPLNVFDEAGQRAQDGVAQYHDLYPAHPRTSSEALNWGVEIEYWKSTYDLNTDELIAKLTRTFTFK